MSSINGVSQKPIEALPNHPFDTVEQDPRALSLKQETSLGDDLAADAILKAGSEFAQPMRGLEGLSASLMSQLEGAPQFSQGGVSRSDESALGQFNGAGGDARSQMADQSSSLLRVMGDTASKINAQPLATRDTGQGVSERGQQVGAQQTAVAQGAGMRSMDATPPPNGSVASQAIHGAAAGSTPRASERAIGFDRADARSSTAQTQTHVSGDLIPSAVRPSSETATLAVPVMLARESIQSTAYIAPPMSQNVADARAAGMIGSERPIMGRLDVAMAPGGYTGTGPMRRREAVSINLMRRIRDVVAIEHDPGMPEESRGNRFAVRKIFWLLALFAAVALVIALIASASVRTSSILTDINTFPLSPNIAVWGAGIAAVCGAIWFAVRKYFNPIK